MLRRPVDLSITTRPSIPSKVTFPPPFGDWENIGPERPRTEMQTKCLVTPFCLDNNSKKIFMDITMGHSTPHTHVDIFMHDWHTMLGEIPKEKKHCQRDVSLVPAGHLVGPTSVVDLSDMEGSFVDLDDFKKRAEHVEENDIVLIKTGHPERHDKNNVQLPLINKKVAQWLVEEKNIRVYGQDAIVNGNFKDWMEVERIFYLNSVTMIDRLDKMKNVDQGRYFGDCGVVLKAVGSDDSPARVKLFSGEGPLRDRQIISLYDPVTFDSKKLNLPTKKQEPVSLIEEIMKRYSVKGVHYTMKEYGRDLIGWASFKTFSNHLGTHINVPFDMNGKNNSWDLATISDEKLCGKASIVNLPQIGCKQNVSVNDLENYGSHIESNDIVVFKTNFSDNYYHRPDFMSYSPGFTNKALKWLVDKNIKMLITDTASIEETPWKFKQTFSDEGKNILLENNTPYIACAGNMWMLEKKHVYISTSPIPLSGLNASPVRVIAIEEHK